MDLDASARAWRPGVTLSALWAPVDSPLVLALSVRWSAACDADGDAFLSDSRGLGADGHLVTAEAAGAHAHARLGSLLVLAAGTRFVGSRWSLEADVELTRGGAPDHFELERLALVHESGQRAAITTLVLGGTPSDHFAIRGGGDVDLVPGFISIGAGYAFESAGVAPSGASPTWPDLDHHLIGLQLTARVESISIDLGVARRLGSSAAVDPGELRVIAPLASGSVPAARGTIDTSSTVVGVAVRGML
jgi:hypothetical protein